MSEAKLANKIERLETDFKDHQNVLGAQNRAVVELRREVAMLRTAVAELARGEQPDLALALARAERQPVEFCQPPADS